MHRFQQCFTKRFGDAMSGWRWEGPQIFLFQEREEIWRRQCEPNRFRTFGKRGSGQICIYISVLRSHRRWHVTVPFLGQQRHAVYICRREWVRQNQWENIPTLHEQCLSTITTWRAYKIRVLLCQFTIMSLHNRKYSYSFRDTQRTKATWKSSLKTA